MQMTAFPKTWEATASPLVPGPDPVLSQPLERWMDAALQAAASNPHTRRTYRTAFGLFLQFLEHERGQWLPDDWRPLATAHADGRRTLWTYRGHAVVFCLVDAVLVEDFRAWRESEGDNPGAALTRWAAVRSCLTGAYRQGLLGHEQAQALALKKERREKRSPRPPAGRCLTGDEVVRLLETVPTGTVKGRRDRALLEMMLYLGLRREEIARIRLADFHQDGDQRWLHLPGKHGQPRHLKIPANLLASLSAWLASVNLDFGHEGALFMSLSKGARVTGRPLHPSMIARLVAEYGHAAGLAPVSGPERLSPRDLRRTCARTAYDHGANLVLIQALLGHRDPRTTAHFIGASEPDSRTAVDYVRYEWAT